MNTHTTYIHHLTMPFSAPAVRAIFSTKMVPSYAAQLEAAARRELNAQWARS